MFNKDQEAGDDRHWSLVLFKEDVETPCNELKYFSIYSKESQCGKRFWVDVKRTPWTYSCAFDSS